MHYPTQPAVSPVSANASAPGTWPHHALQAYPATITFLEDLSETAAKKFPRLSLSTVTQRAYDLTSHAALKGDYATAALMAEAFCRIALYHPHSADTESKTVRLGLRGIAAELVRIVYPYDGFEAAPGEEDVSVNASAPGNVLSLGIRPDDFEESESCVIREETI